MWTSVLVFMLVSPQAAELANHPHTLASPPIATEVECNEMTAKQLNIMKTGLEGKFGKGALLITGACFSDWIRDPEGHLVPVPPEKND